jgi:hypothetical protein
MQRIAYLLVVGSIVASSSCSSSTPSGGDSGGGGDLVSGACTYESPPTGQLEASTCITYKDVPHLAATGGSGFCPTGVSAVKVTTVTSCPATLGAPPLKQLGTCTVHAPALGPNPAYSYTILYYSGLDSPTCAKAKAGCAAQADLENYTSSWSNMPGCG